jgi:hypothetical protein
MTESDLSRVERHACQPRLVSRIGPLLGPDRGVVTRALRGSAADLTWLTVPSVRNAVVLLPPRNSAAAALLRPSGTGKRSAPLRFVAWLQRHRLLRLLPLQRLSVLPSGESPHLLQVLREVFPDVNDVAVRLGRPRYNRPWVLLPTTPSGRVAAYVKVAEGAARGPLEREYYNLARIEATDIPGLHAPAPLAYWTSGPLDLLAMEPLLAPRRQAPRPIPVELMRRVASVAGVQRAQISQAEHVAGMRRRAAELEEWSRHGWVASALGRVCTELGDVEVPLGTWHGDWVPWNMARGAGEVLMWDWEHMETGVPWGWDHVHYLAQDIRVRVGVDEVAESEWLREAVGALRQDWGLDSRQTRAVLLLYLIEMNLRYIADRVQDPRGVGERSGWGRPLIESMLARQDLE